MSRKVGLSLLFIPVIALASAPTLSAQPRHTSEAREADQLFRHWGTPKDRPGSSVLVLRNGAVVYERVTGLADLGQGIVITPHTRFQIASVSKQFTGMCIALLAEQRRLSVSDGLRKYVPELPPVYDDIIIDQLLHHTSGIRDFQTLLDTQGRTDDVNTNRDIIELLARQRGLRFKPGDKFEYSNSGYFLLAVIVERVSGQSLRDFALENVFRPLGMGETEYFDDRGLIVKNLATGYVPNRAGGYSQYRTSYQIVGGAGVVTTPRDLAKWDANFYRNRLPGGDSLIRRMVEPGVLNDGTKVNYGYGFELDTYRGVPVVRHGGAFGGFVSELDRFPDQHFSVIYLTNERGSIDPAERANALADVFLRDRLDAAPAADAALSTQASSRPTSPPVSARDAPASYVGDYYSEELDVLYHVLEVAGELRMRFRNVVDGALLPLGGDDFALYGAVRVNFARNAFGHIAGFTPLDGGAAGIFFVRK